MKTIITQITIEGLQIELVRKRIRNLHLRVYPPDGRVRVSVPLGAGSDTVADFVLGRREWINRCRERFGRQAVPARHYLSGETHHLFGEPLLLQVIRDTGPARVNADGRGNILMHVPSNHDVACRERLLYEWYRCRMKERIPPLLDKWESVVGARIDEWGVKRMKTKWGTCNTRARRIWLNLELALRPLHCLEYVIVHELTHLLEPRHSPRFYGLLGGFMPGWQRHRQELRETFG